jgi:hypothetical protein
MIFDWFWNDRFWLPEALEWKDLEPRVINGTFMQIPQFRDLRYSIFLGVGLLALRILIESFLFLPIGVLGGWMKLQQGTSTLHICFRHLNFGFLGKSKFKRVAESGWRFLYYLSIWIYGIYVVRSAFKMHSLFSYEINRNGPTLMKAGRTILIKE